MPKVWVTNYAGHDYTDAEQYGKIEWITRGYVSFQSLDRVKFMISERLQETSSEDWLLLSGKPVIAAICALSWFVKHKQVKILVWDQKSFGKYRELVITEKNMQDIQEVLET